MKKKIIIFSSIFAVLIAGITCLLVFLLPSKGDGDNGNNSSGGEVIVDPGTKPNNNIKYDVYTSENKGYFLNQVEDVFNVSPETLYPGSTSSWKKNYYKSSLAGLVNAFELADVDLGKFKNLTDFIAEYPTLIEDINFSLKGMINSENVSFLQVMEILSRLENINGIYRIVTAFYDTGITNEDIANVLYYYMQNELSLLNEYRLDLYMSLTEFYDSLGGSVNSFLYSTLYDILPAMYSGLLDSGKEEFVDITIEVLDTINVFMEIYKDYNFYSIVNILTLIKNGDLKPEELTVMTHELEITIDSMIDKETGKAFNISNKVFTMVYSIASKLPLVLNVVSELAGLPNMTEVLPYLANSISSSEEFLNRAVVGLKNVLSMINNEETIFVRDSEGNVTKKLSMAQALSEHLASVASGENVNANSDTVILISKVLAPMFRDNALNSTFLNKFMTDGGGIFSSMIGLLEAFGYQPEEGQEMITRTEFDSNYATFKDVIISFADVITIYASYDLGVSEDVLIDISPSYVILESYISKYLVAIVNEDFASFATLSYLLTVVVATPLLITATPLLLAATVVAAPIFAVYSAVIITKDFSGSDGTASFGTALTSVFAGMFGRAKDEDGNYIADSEEFARLGERLSEQFAGIMQSLSLKRIFPTIINAFSDTVENVLEKIMYFEYDRR